MDETPMARISVEDIMTIEEKPLPAIQKQVSLPVAHKHSKSHAESEEESGLLFVDPEVERRAQLEREKANKKKEMPTIKLKDGTVVQAANFLSGMTGGGPSGPAHSAANQDKTGRLNFLKNLKDEQMKKRSQNITFDKVKQTFMKSELTAEGGQARAGKKLTAAESKNGAQENPLEALNGDLIDDDENDEDFNEDEEGEEAADESAGDEEDEEGVEHWDEDNEELVRRPSRKSKAELEESEEMVQESQDKVNDLPESAAAITNPNDESVAQSQASSSNKQTSQVSQLSAKERKLL
jgi:hypothetical protein